MSLWHNRAAGSNFRILHVNLDLVCSTLSIGLAWHGRDYDTALRDRTADVEEFLDFVATLRTNNWNIPVLVGGDFNMDMRSYDLSSHTHLNIVPYRSDLRQIHINKQTSPLSLVEGN